MKKEPLGKSINILSKLIKKTIDNNLAKYNITMEQSRFLMFLEKNQNNAIYQKDLCDSFHTTKGSVSILLNNLENNNLIKREIGNDARLREIKITTEGLNLLVLVKNELDKNELKMINNFNEEETEMLYSLIKKLIDNIKEVSV